jgi:protein O-GlcNAc transferase
MADPCEPMVHCRDTLLSGVTVLNAPNSTNVEKVSAAHALLQNGQVADAERAFREVLGTDPRNAAALRGLANAYIMSQRLGEAEGVLRQAIAVEPLAESYMNLGQLMNFLKRPEEGLSLLREANQKYPADQRVVAELARLLDHLNRTDEAMSVYEAALSRSPNDRGLVYYFGGLLFAAGEVARAMELYGQYLQRVPHDEMIGSARLYLQHFVPGVTATELLRSHREWDLSYAAAVRNHSIRFLHDRTPERRLRIGYVSPDFKNHGVGRFMAPIFAAHDRTQVEIYAYSAGAAQDEFAQRIRGSVDHWRQIFNLNHNKAMEMIKGDKIDILIDLTMHMPANRLMLFAMRAAPVQVTYLAYCSTTGVTTMDYRLSDPQLDPPEWDGRYSERTIRLPKSWWLYETPTQAPAVQPRDPQKPMTFACLNTTAKISEPTLQAWGKILSQVPGSRLMVLASHGSPRRKMLALLEKCGVSAERVLFADRAPLPQYFALHHEIDIALDPFPYGGGTTTCDALWMGVPVVTLRGDLAVGRGATSILTNVGLPELISENQDGYVQTAVSLANDAERRASLRSTLRDRMLGSPLMDSRGFLAGLEGAYRAMWREWCSRPNV